MNSIDTIMNHAITPQLSGMTLTFPAMHGVMGKRDFYVAIMKLALVPKLFKFRDWAELPPEQRAQRVIQKSRIPEITQYILDNEDGYLFSSLTASFNCDPVFTPVTSCGRFSGSTKCAATQ